MIKIKLLLVTLALTFSSITSFAQDEDGDVLSIGKLFDLFTTISNNIDKLINKQDAKRLYRHLDYFRNDMNRYLVIRKDITNYLENKNYSSFDTIRVKEAVLDLQMRMIKIARRLREVQEYSSETLSGEIEKVLENIDDGTTGQIAFLNRLEEFADGEKTDKKQLRQDANAIFIKLKNSITVIDQIKGKLKVKFGI